MNRFLITIPKSGTHLMRYILGWDDRGHRISLCENHREHKCRLFSSGFSGHFRYNPVLLNDIAGDMVPIFLYRDPRDIIVSWVYWANSEQGSHWYYKVDDTVGWIRPNQTASFQLRRMKPEPPELADFRKVKDPIAKFIEWMPGTFMQYAGWLDEPGVLKVTYEGLITDPENELAPIAEAIEEPLGMLVERSKFRGGDTYRKGIVGDWKNVFEPHHIEAFNANYAEIMETYGYQL